MKIIDLLSSSDRESQLLGIQLLKSHKDYESFKNKYENINYSFGTISYTIEDNVNYFNRDYKSTMIFSEMFRDVRLKTWCISIIHILNKHHIDI